jgi:hypothetical protein
MPLAISVQRSMKVTLTKHGGLGALRLPPLSVDSSRLDPAEKKELAALVDAAKAPVSDLPVRGADLMSYTIAVEDDGKQTLLRQPHANMTPGFKALRNWLEERAKAK